MERRTLGQDSQITLMDPPAHTKHRQPINKYFSVPALARMSNAIEAIGDQIIARVAGRGECDFVNDMAGELPMYVVLEFIGAPREDWDYLRAQVLRRFTPSDPAYAVEGKTTRDIYIEAQSELNEYAKRLAVSRRVNPKDDFATIVSQLAVDGTPLDEEEIATWCMLLIIAGLESTRNAIALGLWLFRGHPEQRKLLLDNPNLTKPAVEEVLRWVTPSRVRLRVARADTKLRDKTIKAGDWVVSLLNSANKDERVHEDPHRFDITRKPVEHFAFGHGIHLCLGRALARLEMASFIPKVLRTFPDLTLASNDKPDWIADFMVTGISRLDLKYSPVSVAD
jgi:cholest-4-en-3-one 26-monooxygenase